MQGTDRYAPLCHLIRQNFRTMSAFAKAIGLHPSTLSAKLNGKTQWAFWEVAKACEVLGIPLVDAPQYFPPRVA